MNTLTYILLNSSKTPVCLLMVCDIIWHIPVITFSSVSKSGLLRFTSCRVETLGSSPYSKRFAYSSKPRALALSAKEPLLAGL